jgi:hypothetical protein
MAMARLRADDRRGVKTDELVVEGEDLRPIGVADVAGGDVHRVDRDEELIATRSHTGSGSGQALAHQPMTFGDQFRVPGPTVLLVERDQFAETRAVRRASISSISASSPATSRCCRSSPARFAPYVRSPTPTLCPLLAVIIFTPPPPG